MDRIRDNFDRQGFRRTLGAALESVEPGTVAITCGFVGPTWRVISSAERRR
jgi:hypothetical protein